MDDLDWRREIPEDIESRRRWVNALRNSIAERLTLEELETYLKTRRRRTQRTSKRRRVGRNLGLRIFWFCFELCWYLDPCGPGNQRIKAS